MAEHPIEGLMKTAMESIRDMVDVNTIVGDAVQAPDGTVIIPISRVCFGFAAGGGEYASGSKHGKNDEDKDEDSEDCDQKNESGIGNDSNKFPFAGGSGAGVSINPVAFMVVGNEQIKLLPVNINSSFERVLDLIPEIINKANDAIKKKITVRKEIKTGNNNKKSVQETEEE